MEDGSTICYLDQLITLKIQMKMPKMKRWWVKSWKLHNIDKVITKGFLEVNYERLSLWGCIKKSWLYFCTHKSVDLTPFYLYNFFFLHINILYISIAPYKMREREREEKKPPKDMIQQKIFVQLYLKLAI